jgi:hypothetical protein
MVKNPEELRRIEDELASREHLTLEERFALLDGLYDEARQFGRFSDSDLLEGVENDFRVASILNALVHQPPRANGPRA